MATFRETVSLHMTHISVQFFMFCRAVHLATMPEVGANPRWMKTENLCMVTSLVHKVLIYR